MSQYEYPADSTPYDQFLAGGSKYEWACLECPTLLVTTRGASQHRAMKAHDVRHRTELALFFPAEGEEIRPHPYIACKGARPTGSRDPYPTHCAVCYLTKAEHARA